jgi:glyoxalase family protein
MGILGIHHVGIVSSDRARTLDYYTGVLGLMALGDGFVGVPGSIIAIEEQRGAAPGVEGVGGTHHFALRVETRDALLQWKRRLVDHGVRVNGPLDRHYFESIYHRDPDGQVIEIATRGAGWTRDEAPDAIGTEHRPPPPEMLKGNMERERILAETWPEPVPDVTDDMRIRKFHHVTAIGDDIERTHAFVHDALGMRRVKRTSNFDMPDSFHWYWGVGDGEPGTVVTYFERRGAPAVAPGPGQVCRYALAVADDAALEAMRERLIEARVGAGPIVDGAHYRSFRTRDPNGQTVEVATPFDQG